MSGTNTREPVQKRSRQKKRALIVCGMKIFAHKSYDQCTIAEICTEADVAVGTFYCYFKDKKELLKEVVALYGNRIISSVYGGFSEKKSHQKGSETIEELIQASIDAHSLSPGLHKEIGALVNRFEFIKKHELELEKTVTEKTLAILKNSNEDIRIVNLEPAADVICSAIEKTVHKCLIDNNGKKLNEKCEALKEMISRYLFKDA